MTIIPRAKPHRLGRLLSIALWFGLVAGLLQVGARLVATLLFERAIALHPQLVWMAPVASCIVMLAALSILMLVGTVFPFFRRSDVATSVFATLSALTLVLPYPRASVYALVVLCAGMGVHLARRLARLPFNALVRRTLPVLLAAVATAGTAVNAARLWREEAGYARLARTEAGAPNVLFVIWDTVRAANLGLYGYSRPTSPFLDQFARGGVIFDRAFATAPWTLASHAGFFTGFYPFDLSTTWRTPLDDTHATIAELMAGQGFATGAFMGNRIFGAPVFGLDRGFIHYESAPSNVLTLLDLSPVIRRLTRLLNDRFENHYIPDRVTAGDINRRFLEWQRQRPDDPFFAFLNYFDAHEPYSPPASWDRRFGDPDVRGIPADGRVTAQVSLDLRDGYDGGIAYIDAEFEALIQELDRRGVLSNTIVIVSSDHGEQLGENGLYDHGNSLYPALLHVPLIIRGHGIPSDLRIAEPVSLRDLPATILDLQAGARHQVPGTSLARFWNTEPGSRIASEAIFATVPFARNQPEGVPLGQGDMQTVIAWPFQYIRNGDGVEELFDLSRDPFGLWDLANADPAGLARLRTLMDHAPRRFARVQQP